MLGVCGGCPASSTRTGLPLPEEPVRLPRQTGQTGQTGSDTPSEIGHCPKAAQTGEHLQLRNEFLVLRHVTFTFPLFQLSPSTCQSLISALQPLSANERCGEVTRRECDKVMGALDKREREEGEEGRGNVKKRRRTRK